jgi:Holliday junction resolvase
MSDFERDIVHCINNYLETRGISGFAYRLKQSKYSAQYIDVLVDSLDPRYYLAVECKSIRGKKIYFTQHFHQDKNAVHQIDAISDFLSKTGRRGFLAVEFRAGSGKAKEAFLMPWTEVVNFYQTRAGISIEDFRITTCLLRNSDGYSIRDLYPKVFDEE